jgi:hypothetical protein
MEKPTIVLVTRVGASVGIILFPVLPKNGHDVLAGGC